MTIAAPMQYKKAGIILVDGQGRVLLIHGVGGKWSFPKGHAEEIDGANPLVTAMRETQEEVGLGPFDYQLLSMQPIAFPFDTYFYLGIATAMTVPFINDGEGTEVRWCSRKELTGMWTDLNIHVKHYVKGH
jgi:8-oxo-dGTP pyrophosphatase MutT (NUDIX family)